MSEYDYLQKLDSDILSSRLTDSLKKSSPKTSEMITDSNLKLHFSEALYTHHQHQHHNHHQRAHPDPGLNTEAFQPTHQRNYSENIEGAEL